MYSVSLESMNILQAFAVDLGSEEKDLEYFVKEVGDIFGVTANLPADNRAPKKIIEYMFYQIAEFKKINQVGDN